MGQEIVYCFRCLGRLTGADFEKGKGFRHEGKAVCLPCAQALLETARGTEREALEALLRKIPARKVSNPALPTLPASTESSRKLRALAAVPQDRKPASRTRVYLVAALGAIAVVALAVLALSSRKESVPAPVLQIEKTAPPPAPPPPPSPPPPRPASPFAAELEEIDRQVRPLTDKEEFGPALDLLEAVRRRRSDPAWDRAVAERIARVEEALRALYAPLREEAVAARRAGDAARVDRVLERVRRWKSDRLMGDLEEALAAAAPAPPPPPPPPAPSKDRAAYEAVWKRAMTLAAARAHAAAIRELEALLPRVTEPDVRADLTEDLRLFRAAQNLLQKGIKALRERSLGFNVSIVALEPDGKTRRHDQPLLRIAPTHLELRETPPVTFAEILPTTLAELAGAPKSEAAAVLCCLEGHPLTAGKLWNRPTIPDRYFREAEAIKSRRTSEREAQAGRLFREAFEQWLSPAARVEGLRGLERLKKEFGDTLAAARQEAVLEAARPEGAREYFLAAGDLKSSGALRPRRYEEARAAWTCGARAADRPDPDFLEFEFSALGGTAYRAWVYAGACCLEHFAFGVQVTDHPSASIGSEGSIPVTPSALLPRTHSAHPARGEPARWEWVLLPLPAFRTEGRKTVRLVRLRENFSAAWVFVSSARTAPLPLPEAREAERERPTLPIPPAPRSPRGRILREYWTDIDGNELRALKEHPLFIAGRPTGAEWATSLEGPRDWRERYGTRFRGYLWPPATGEYTFWISGDDQCELWLSPNEDPGRKQKIAHVPGFTDPRQWERDPAQKSRPVSLVRGRRYYIEVLHKQGGGGDHVAVGWQLPDGTLERPIPGRRLSPPLHDPLTLFTSPLPGDAFPARADLTVELETVNLHPVRIELFHASTKLGELRPSAPAYRWTNIPAGSHPLLARVTDRSGEVLLAPPVHIRVGEVSFYRGINLNGPPCVIDGQKWEGRDAKNLEVRGRGFGRPDAELRVPAESARADMIRSSIRDDDVSIALTSVPKGAYLVYLYVWESETSRTYDVTLNGKVVQSRFASGPAGHWERLGPWTADVSDGKIEVRTSGGPAHVSGLEIWRLGADAK
ncbi:MAG TPA: PA14 domain-containing protein [Planctomycetota bacterium]|nr:PA14 domain-containing protein [Planctomycetota bacterium]